MPQVRSAGASAATHHTTQAWLSRPASKLRAVHCIQPVSASWMTLPRGSGLTCSSNRANKTAKKLIAGDDTGGVSPVAPARRVSRREEAVEVSQHRRGRAPDEVAARAAVGAGAGPGQREELAPHAARLDRMALVVGRVHQPG